MTTTILIITAVFIFGIGFGAANWFLRRSRPDSSSKIVPAASAGIAFNWRYISLPLLILAASLVLTAIFYGQLPEEVAYRFTLDGDPDAYTSAGAAVALMLGIQVLFMFLAWLIIRTVIRMGFFNQQIDDTLVKPEKMLSVMGNMMAIPNLIMAFALLDIFSYNAYEVHYMPLWLFAVIALVVGSVVLGIVALPVILKLVKSFNQP